MKIDPRTMLGSAILLVPSQAVSHWIANAPATAPANVPRPPTMIQMMICAENKMLNTVGPMNEPQLANKIPAIPAIPAPIMNTMSL